MRRLAQAAAFVVALCASTLPVFALGPVPADVPPLRKLGRGLSNTFLSIVEIPFRMAKVGREDGPFAGVTLGLVAGLGNAAVRTAAGIIEVVTFPFPIPRPDYEPLVQPEFLFQTDSAWTDEWRRMDGSP
jgi:putative exosortase-associated protein (TIGR04073 family)